MVLQEYRNSCKVPPWAFSWPSSTCSLPSRICLMSGTQGWRVARAQLILSQGILNLLGNVNISKKLWEKRAYARQKQRQTKTQPWNLGSSKFELIKTPLNGAKNNYFKSRTCAFVCPSVYWETVRLIESRWNWGSWILFLTLLWEPVLWLKSGFRCKFGLSPLPKTNITGCMIWFTSLNFSFSNLWSGANNPYLPQRQWVSFGSMP